MSAYNGASNDDATPAPKTGGQQERISDHDMTDDQLSRILEQHKVWLASGGQDGCRADLSGMDLSGADLSGADLREAIAVLANFAKANLAGVRLIMADLSQADMRGSGLGGADLSGADLMLADLSEANLSAADLSVADLSGVTFTGARLCAAALQQSNLSGADFSRADLSQVNLSGADLSGARFNGARLRGADLSGSRLVKTDLTDAILVMIDLTDAFLEEVRLTGVTIDPFTEKKLSRWASPECRHTFQIVTPDFPGRWRLQREISFKTPFFRGGAAILSGFLSFLSHQFPEPQCRSRLEFSGSTLKLAVEADDPTTYRELEELFDICGRVLLGDLAPHILSNDAAAVEAFIGSWEYAREMITLERGPVSPDRVASDLKRLFSLLGRLLLNWKEMGEAAGKDTILYRSQAVHNFQDFLKSLLSQDRLLARDIKLIIEKLNIEFPDDADMAEIEKSLVAVKQKSPERFDEVAEAFHDFGLGDKSSVWTDVFLDLLDRMAGC